MAGITPIPTSRISGLLTRQRLTQQYQTDQLDLFRLQEQISTGYRISTPSEDAPAAIRAISLQRLLSRKDQLNTNITTGLQHLASTDTAINDIAGKLSEIKANTLGSIGTVETQEQRDEVAREIDLAIQDLVNKGNGIALGRYLFGGSQTSEPPYSYDDRGNVVYSGDDSSLRSYSDLGVLFSSNTSGQEVFGGISDAVEGTADLNPQLTADTLLSSLRGGRGINPNGSLQISNLSTDPNETSIVDISNASTVGDLVRLIEDNPPAGSTIDVAITGSGLTITETGSNATISVSEVGTGTTATELGLPTDPSATIVGEDLNPLVLKTTKIDDLLGSKARATLRTTGDNNDILIEGSENGDTFDGVAVTFVDGGLGSPVGVAFDDLAKTLVITIDEGSTTAQDVVDAINADGSFTAELDLVDSSTISAAGTGLVSSSTAATTDGGSGATFNRQPGIRVVNGGDTFDISFSGDETVEDLLNTLNSAEAGLLAEINADGDGINIRSRLSGQDFQIGEISGGITATQLGVRTYNGDTRLSDFNYGVGVPTRNALETNITNQQLEIAATDGSPAFTVDLSLLVDPSDLSQLVIAINTESALNGSKVTAQLASDGGIELVDNIEGNEPLTVTQSGADLGVIGGIDFTASRPDFSIAASTGQSFTINVGGAETVQDILDLINNDAGNDDVLNPGNPLVVARLAQSGNGIELVDANAGPLTVTKLGDSQAAEFLGLLGKGEDTATSAAAVLTGTDQHFLETDSVFTNLIRLRDALTANDLPAIERAAAKFDDDIQRVTFAQADAGARSRGLIQTRENLEDEVVQLRSALSEEIDVDLVQAISDLTARQVSLEASLRATANILQLSLLNFI